MLLLIATFSSMQKFRSSCPEVSVKKIFLEISQKSQENTCVRVFFKNKVSGLRPATVFKKILWHKCFPVNFVKFSRKPFFSDHLLWLLLKVILTKKFGMNTSTK